MVREVVIPYKPRELQLDFHNRAERFAVTVCHRRFGKTVMLANDLIRSVLTCDKPNPRVAYVAPTYKQAKRIAWDYVKHFSQPIPGVKANESELRVDFPNGGRLNLYGADNPDSLRGVYLDDVALDEYQDIHPRVWHEIVSPALSDRGGRAAFSGTPRGRQNPLYEIYTLGQQEGWYVAMHRASETGYINAEELELQSRIKSDDAYQQEYECSWDAAYPGAIYAKLIEDAREDQRIGIVPYDPHLSVDTSWDLGMRDSTSIWLIQSHAQQDRLVGYYEATGEALSHYAHWLQEWAAKRSAIWGDHYLPHDANARELGTGKSRAEVLQALGLKSIIAPRLPIEDGIEATRALLRRCWIDEKNCEQGLNALINYRRDYDEKTKTMSSRPVHDWSSHGSDALRTYATGKREKSAGNYEYQWAAEGGWMAG